VANVPESGPLADSPGPRSHPDSPGHAAKIVEIFTDGACSPNPGPGGWGAVLKYGRHRREIYGGEPATTNNRMEIMAAIRGLESLTRPSKVHMYTDSQYLRRGVTEWLPQWRHNGWQTKEKKPIKNADLWKRLDSAARGHQAQWFWLKGHAGHPENERAGAYVAPSQPAYHDWGPGASDIYGSLLSQATDEPAERDPSQERA